MAVLSGWGRYGSFESEMVAPESADAIRFATLASEGSVARGNGRAYGDAAIGVENTISMTGMDRMRAFYSGTGRLTVEAGVLLTDIIATFLPRGFFLKVVPGTRHVTVGGAIAADVHGKNDHRDGSFGDYVESFLLVTGNGDVLRASRDENAEVFFATIGGMGLTGTLVEATIRLTPVETGWIRQRTIVAPDLSAAIAAFDANENASYSVAWLDCSGKGANLGRSLVYLGEHARLDELRGGEQGERFPKNRRTNISVPIDFPDFALNRLSVAAFNELYFRVGARKAGNPRLVAFDPYFFPLDALDGWNRIYGRRGFVQHQCVLPSAVAAGALAEILDRVSRRGGGSFLAVLKKLKSGNGLMSFPMDGFTLALDFAVSPGLTDFLDELDTTVVKAGGRLYLAKDARQSRDTFAAGYPLLDQFREVRRVLDPRRRIRSRLAERLGI